MLFNYNRKNIVLIILLVTVCVFTLINILMINYTEHIEKVTKQATYFQKEQISSTKENIENNIINTIEINAKDRKEENITDSNEWNLKIKKINLDANINEDTCEEVLNNSIGHFAETSKWDGNIGLAAHNRGYKNNFFERINELEYGDEIEYTYKGKIKKYQVIIKEEILNNDWSYLSRNKKNKITLITCIKNNPKYRLCVQAEEI